MSKQVSGDEIEDQLADATGEELEQLHGGQAQGNPLANTPVTDIPLVDAGAMIPANFHFTGGVNSMMSGPPRQGPPPQPVLVSNGWQRLPGQFTGGVDPMELSKKK
jgi:hypothetical protein